MPNYLLSKEFKFDAAHMLEGHCGKCKNLHGHTYTVVVSFKKSKLNSNGSSKDMVVDFYNVKEFVNPIIDSLDHSFIYNCENDIENKIGMFVESFGLKTYKINFRSTCENLSAHFYSLLKPKFSSLYNVKVFETVGSSCEYSE